MAGEIFPFANTSSVLTLVAVTIFSRDWRARMRFSLDSRASMGTENPSFCTRQLGILKPLGVKLNSSLFPNESLPDHASEEESHILGSPAESVYLLFIFFIFSRTSTSQLFSPIID